MHHASPSKTEVAHEFIVAVAHEGVVGKRCSLGVDDLVAVAFARTADGFGVAVADAEFGNDAAVGLTVGSDVEVEEMSVAVLDGAGDARCAVVAAATGEHKGAAFLDEREEAVELFSRRGGNCDVLDRCIVFSEQNISMF